MNDTTVFTKTNIRYCKCGRCGKPMSLGWDDDDQGYVAFCLDCDLYQPISDNDHPPRIA